MSADRGRYAVDGDVGGMDAFDQVSVKIICILLLICYTKKATERGSRALPHNYICFAE